MLIHNTRLPGLRLIDLNLSNFIETSVSPNAIIIPTPEANGNTDNGKWLNRLPPKTAPKAMPIYKNELLIERAV